MLSTMTAAPVYSQLISVDGRTLPLRAVELQAHAQGGLCRTVLVQHFANPHAEPLAVTYTLPLPHQGVVIPPGAPWGGYPLNAAQMRVAMARAGRRILLAFGVVTAGSLLILTLLITALVVHGGLLGVVAGALLTILAAGVAAVGALVWLARRLWRRHAWIEAVPLVAGQLWLSRVARMARLLLTGHALWRLRTRLASRA